MYTALLRIEVVSKFFYHFQSMTPTTYYLVFQIHATKHAANTCNIHSLVILAKEMDREVATAVIFCAMAL